MKKRTFDIIVIFLIAIFLISLNQFGLLEKSAKFMFIPILAFYFSVRLRNENLKNDEDSLAVVRELYTFQFLSQL
jgi:hypothetical protein